MRRIRAFSIAILGVTFALPVAAQVVVLRTSAGAKTQVQPGGKLTLPVVLDMSAASPLNVGGVSSTVSWGASVLTLDSIRPAAFTSLNVNLSGVPNGAASFDAGAPQPTSSTTTVANLYFTAASSGGTTVAFSPTLLNDGTERDLLSHIRMLDLDVCIASGGRWGDANGDNTVNIIDAQQVARFSVGLSVSNASIVSSQGDVNADNNINIIDAQQVARFAVGLTAAARVNTLQFTPPTVSSLLVTNVFAAENGGTDRTSANLSGLAVGNQARIRPRATDANNADVTACATITYSSSNTSVASVSSTGLITANGTGSATITVAGGNQTATLNVTVITYGTIATKAGTRLVVDPAGAANPSVQPVFIARDGAGALAQGVPVDLNIDGRCTFDLGQNQFASFITMHTDAVGEVKPTVALPPGTGGVGCTIYASSYDTQFQGLDSAQVIAYPPSATHVWTGAADLNWSNAANWVRPGSTPAVPATPSDNVFIPYSAYYNQPTLIADIQVRGIALDTAASVNLSSHRVDVGAGGVTGSGYFANGIIRLVASATLSGSFDQLEIGQPGSCGATPMTASPLELYASSLRMYCRTSIDTTRFVYSDTATLFANGGQGILLVNRGGVLDVGYTGTFVGDNLVVAGDLYVNGDAIFGGQAVNATSTAFIYVGGNAALNAASATYTGSELEISGTTTIGGGTAGSQRFIGGFLYIYGDFVQKAGAVTNTFVTSANHEVIVEGSAAQTITLADPASAVFSTLYVGNQSLGLVTFASNANIARTTGTSTVTLFDLFGGTLVIPANVTVTVTGGDVFLAAGTQLTVNGSLVIANGTCTGRNAGANVNGSGTVNGQPAATACP